MAVIVRDSGVPQLSATNTFRVVVYPPNTAPVLAPLTNQTVFANTLLTFTATATDIDQPSQSLSFSLAGAPSGAVMATNGVFTWTPTPSQAPSTNTMAVIVRDSGVPQLSATNTFRVVVYPPNTAPALAPLTNQTVFASTLLTFTATATDADQPPQLLTFALETNAPAGASITTNGVFTWTPSSAQAPSTNSITVRVSDNGVPRLSDTTTFVITVTQTNTVTLALQWAASLHGSFADETNAVVDTVLKTVTTSVMPSQRFYRLRSDSVTRISRIRLQGSQLLITYE
jgi:hypothetical protein